MPIPASLMERHDELVGHLRTHLAEVESGGYADDAEAEARYKAINTDLTDVEVRMAGFRRLDEADQAGKEARAMSADLGRSGSGSDTGLDTDPDEPKVDPDLKAWRSLTAGEARAVNFHRPERRDLTVAADPSVISTGFVPRLYDFMEEHAAIRQTRATVLTTASGNSLKFPKATAHSSAALVGEGAAIGESDPTFAQMTLDAYKYAFIIQVSHEMENDEEVGLLDFLATQAGRALGDATGTAAITGTGTAQPQGIEGVATTGLTAAATTAVTADELIDFQHSVIPAYRRNAEWVLNDASLGAVRKLVGSDNNYLWRPGLADGAPATLLGSPYVIDTNVADMTAANSAFFYGDWSTFYLRDVESVRVERSVDYAFDTDLVSYRFITRFDSDLVDVTGAIKALVMAAV